MYNVLCILSTVSYNALHNTLYNIHYIYTYAKSMKYTH